MNSPRWEDLELTCVSRRREDVKGGKMHGRGGEVKVSGRGQNRWKLWAIFNPRGAQSKTHG